MIDDIVRVMLGQQQRQLDDWLAAQAAGLDLSVEELAEQYFLEAGPVELCHDEDRGTYYAEQNYRLRPRSESS